MTNRPHNDATVNTRLLVNQSPGFLILYHIFSTNTLFLVLSINTLNSSDVPFKNINPINPSSLHLTSEPFEDAIQSQSHPLSKGQAQSQVSSLHKAASVDNSSPLLVRSLALRAQEELEGQTWYHGKMSRRDAEKLLKDDGNFLVRKSTTNPGSYVLTGMHNGLAKHLLLVDPEGTVRGVKGHTECVSGRLRCEKKMDSSHPVLFSKVRTKDHIFDSISHLIGHYRDNNLPIVSAGSELCLLQPVGRKH